MADPRGRILLHEHAVPVRVEPVFLFYRLMISSEYLLPPTEGAHQHQQRRLWQMKICQHGADNSKLKSWVDKQVGIASACLHSPRFTG